MAASRSGGGKFIVDKTESTGRGGAVWRVKSGHNQALWGEEKEPGELRELGQQLEAKSTKGAGNQNASGVRAAQPLGWRVQGRGLGLPVLLYNR